MDVHAIVWATFASNSFSLSTQWEYDQGKIAEKIGKLDYLGAPVADGYHANEVAGGLCNYGSHVFNLLKYIAQEKTFNLSSYQEYWKQYFENYTGYKDQASKRFAAGHQGNSHFPLADFIAAIRFTPLLLLEQEQEKLFDLAWQESSMTHNNQQAHDTLRCMLDALFLVQEGLSPIDALVQASRPFSNLVPMVDTGLQSAGISTNTVMQKIGTTCGIDVCLPNIAHLLASYDNLTDMLMANNMAGGDVAARAMGASILMVAQQGMQALPENWVRGLQKYDEIAQIMDSFPRS